MDAALRWTIEVAVALLIASGCAAAHEAEEHYDERRLRVVMDRPESGEPTFVGFFDPEFSQFCAPMVTEDGLLRCVPDSPVGRLYADYADPGCTEPIDTGLGLCQMRYVVEEVHPDACGASSYVRVFEESEEAEWFDSKYQRSSRTGECYSIGPGTARRLTLVPPRRMVWGEMEPGSGPNRLVADTIAWADGTRGPAQIRDSDRREPCTIRGALNGRGPAVCSPRARAYEGSFGRECDERWARAIPDGCALTSDDFVVSTECESVSVAMVGDVVSEAERDAAPGCSLSYEGQVVYSLSPAPDDLLPWLRLELRGEGRLRRRVWVDEDGGEWMASGYGDYYDSELDVDCLSLSWTEERCLPPASVQRDEERLFADERCTEPAAVVTSADALSCRDPEYVWRGRCADAVGTIGPFSTSSEPAGLYRFGEPVAGAPYKRDETTGECRIRAFNGDVSVFRLVPTDLDALAVVPRALE